MIHTPQRNTDSFFNVFFCFVLDFFKFFLVFFLRFFGFAFFVCFVVVVFAS